MSFWRLKCGVRGLANLSLGRARCLVCCLRLCCRLCGCTALLIGLLSAGLVPEKSCWCLCLQAAPILTRLKPHLAEKNTGALSFKFGFKNVSYTMASSSGAGSTRGDSCARSDVPFHQSRGELQHSGRLDSGLGLSGQCVQL